MSAIILQAICLTEMTLQRYTYFLVRPKINKQNSPKGVPLYEAKRCQSEEDYIFPSKSFVFISSRLKANHLLPRSFKEAPI